MTLGTSRNATNLWLGFGVALSLGCLAGQTYARQDPQQSQQQTPPITETKPASLPSDNPDSGPKKHKVWQNEDVIALRTPADLYILEKEAREAAEAEAAEKAAVEAEAAAQEKTPPGLKLPATQEETEASLKDREDELQEESSAVAKLESELPDTPDVQKPDKQKEIDRLSDNKKALEREVLALRDHLKAFADKKNTDNSAAVPQAPQTN